MKQLILINTDEAAMPEIRSIDCEGLASITLVRNTAELLRAMTGASGSAGACVGDARVLSEIAALPAGVLQDPTSSPLLYPVRFGDEIISCDSLEADNAVAVITRAVEIPTALLDIPAAELSDLEIPPFKTTAEAIHLLVLALIGKGCSVTLSATELSVSGTASSLAQPLDDSARARLLNFAVNSINIEDLFPNNSWELHEEESAAACFHTLAAHFIRFGDLATAEECLTFSDRLEDSPRSLALRGLISRRNGETLGAVANLVSSLQQYETRKRATEIEHYISFSPSNLEVINTSLHDGLSALNKQENDAAFSHFAKAIFNFDTFYSETGMDSVE